MAINPHDDYEKLAKLLYPSIEASGNVYYGQTRKLALDELFDKNKGGFHAHIESLYNDDYAKYETFFCWELGPLKGVIIVDSDLSCIPIYFAKYKLNIVSSEDDTELHSGNFKTYKQSVTAVYNSVLQTNGKNPIDSSKDWDGANFYINKENGNYYIYIAIKNIAYEKYEEPEYVEGNELTFTVLDNDVDVALVSNGTIANKEVYEYSTNGIQWNELDADSNTVTVDAGDYIKIRLRDNVQKSQQSYSNNLKFNITGTGHISISGDIRSLQQDKYSIAQYEFCDLFKDNATIVDVSKLELPASTLALSCYYGMFRNCTALINMPILPSINVINTCYSSMFNGCTSLKDITPLLAVNLKYGCYMSMFFGCTALTTSPLLYAKTLANNCYAYMFYNCSNLNKVCIHAKDISTTQCLLNWLSDVAAIGDFYCVSDVSYPAGVNGIPSGWTRHNIYNENYSNGEHLFNKLKANESLITSGTDSIYNGRGLLSEDSSLYKYEKIFDENNKNKMNSYNNDGSFNQEIWGYKSFNSPVKFRNGIYGEQAKLVTTHEVKDNILTNYLTENDSYSEHIENKGSKLSSYTNANDISSNVTVLNTSRVISNNENNFVVRNELGECASLMSGETIVNISSCNGVQNKEDWVNIGYTDLQYSNSNILLSTSCDEYYSTIKVYSSIEDAPGGSSGETYIELKSNNTNDNRTSYIKVDPYNVYLNSENLYIGDKNNSRKINIDTYRSNIQTTCNIMPSTTGVDLGSTSISWDNVYSNKFISSNTSYYDGGFQVDGQGYTLDCAGFSLLGQNLFSIISSGTFSTTNKQNSAGIIVVSSSVTSNIARPTIVFSISDEEKSNDSIRVASIEYDNTLTEYVFKADSASFNKIYVSSSTFSNIVTAEEIYILSSIDHTVDATLKLQSNAISVSKDIAPANNSGTIQNCGRLEYPWQTIYARSEIVLTAGDMTTHVFTITEDDGCVVFDNSLSGGDAGCFLFATNNGNNRAKVMAKEFIGFNSTISDINPRTSSSYKIAVGSLVFAIPGVIWTDAKRGQTFNPGDILDFTNTANSLWFVARQNVNSSTGAVSWDHGASEPEDTLQPGKYKLLNILKINDYGTHVSNVDSPVLLQRVE